MKASEELQKLIETLQPATVLAITDRALSLSGDISTTSISGITQLEELKRHRLAYVSDFPKTITTEEGHQILAALRDLKADIVYALLSDDDSRWVMSELRALGFRHIKAYTDESPSKTLYYFDIYDYKLTPDWLNPRFWANPDRWDIQEG